MKDRIDTSISSLARPFIWLGSRGSAMATPRFVRFFRPTHVAAPRAMALVGVLWLLAPVASADDLSFTPPQFLPGDTAIGLAAGHQQEVEIAAGGAGNILDSFVIDEGPGN